MDPTESTTAAKMSGPDGTQEVLMAGKPLHRFVQKQPRVFGTVVGIFGCVELLIGVLCQDQEVQKYYVQIWQGALFLVCGILSIYTEIKPSKKMVTVSLAMYVVSLLGGLVSLLMRIFTISFLLSPWYHFRGHQSYIYMVQSAAVEGIMLASSLCVFGLLIFLSSIARFALKSTHTQMIVLHGVGPPQTEEGTN